jgi:hypothetical protein
MIYLTVLVTGQEWAKLRDAAKEQFPNETLGRGEITRRFAMAGIEATKRLTERDRARLAYELRSSQHVAGPEGDKPRTGWD